MQKDYLDVGNRKNVIDRVRRILVDRLGSNIVSAIVYGSTLNEDFCVKSDYDILIVAQNPDIEFLQQLRSIKLDFIKQGITIDFNVHDIGDIPSVRKELFWHNNRGLYVQKEFDIYGKVIIGDNLLKTDNINDYEMLKEAVKVINSLNYQARKTIINKDTSNSENKILMMKWCIYGSLYALASRGIYPKERKTALKVFCDVFDPPINPEIFLHIKVTRSDNITEKDVNDAYSFLRYLDRKIFEDYQNYKKGNENE